MTSLSQVDHTEKQWPVHLFRKTTKGWEKMQPKNSRNQLVVVKATPREGCIVLLRLRIRVSLTPRKSGQEEDESRSVVVRRRASIFISSNQGLKALVLKFRSEQDCLEFADRFTALNPPKALLVSKEVDDTVAESGGQNLTRHIDSHDQSQEVLFYIARLLHDQDFVDYVNNLESCLASSTDGAKILDVLTKAGITDQSTMGTGSNF
jgi:hypothetical protein